MDGKQESGILTTFGKKTSTTPGTGFQTVAPRATDALQWPVKMLKGRMLKRLATGPISACCCCCCDSCGEGGVGVASIATIRATKQKNRSNLADTMVMLQRLQGQSRKVSLLLLQQTRSGNDNKWRRRRRPPFFISEQMTTTRLPKLKASKVGFIIKRVDLKRSHHYRLNWT